jgi:hypothetical protein
VTVHTDVLYLSRSAVFSIWPGLRLGVRNELDFKELEAKATVSIAPSFDITGKWGATEPETPPPSAGGHLWPPWNADSIVQAINSWAARSAQLGNASDLIHNRKRFDYFAAEATLEGPPEVDVHSLGRHGFRSHILETRLNLQGDTFLCPLSLENLAGMSWDGTRWTIQSSLVFAIFEALGAGNLHVRGLLRYAGPRSGYNGILRAVYLQLLSFP